MREDSCLKYFAFVKPLLVVSPHVCSTVRHTYFNRHAGEAASERSDFVFIGVRFHSVLSGIIVVRVRVRARIFSLAPLYTYSDP